MQLTPAAQSHPNVRHRRLVRLRFRLSLSTLRQSLPMIGRHLWPSIAELKPHCPALPCPALHCPALHCTALHCPALQPLQALDALGASDVLVHRMLHAIIKVDWPAARGVLLHAQALARYPLMLRSARPRNFRPPAQQLCQQCSSMTPVVAASEFACVAVGNATRRSETFCFCALGFRA